MRSADPSRTPLSLRMEATLSVSRDTGRAMSQENVEALRWLYGEWAKGNMWALKDWT